MRTQQRRRKKGTSIAPGLRSWAKDLYQLMRLPLSAAVALSALAGCWLHPYPGGGAPTVLLGVLLLACGSSALNQVQERKTDALMERTRLRPLAAGRMRPATALLLSLGFIVAGLALLARSGSPTALLLGAFSVFWYGAVYAPLKRRTSLAIIAGALCGALPPLIGWAAAGGSPTDPRIALPAGLFFLWQIPHFWRLTLFWQDDYRRAGFPLLCDIFSENQCRRILFAWILALAFGALPLVLFGYLQQPAARLLGGSLLLALTWIALRGLFTRGLPLPRMAHPTNLFIPLFTLTLLIDRLLP